MVTLVEKAQQEFDLDQQEKLQAKMAKGQFTLADFVAQMQQMKKLGPMKEILKLIPGLGSQVGQIDMPEDALSQMEAIIHSMTPAERENPKTIDGSRRRRIARGSGSSPEDVSGLVKNFTQMQHMMQQMAGMGPMDRMRMARQMGQMDMAGGMPNMKMRQRSKRLTKKERAKKKRKGKR